MLIALLLLQPELAHQGANEGIRLFINALFPYLLPYLVLTQWLLRLTKKSTQTKGRLMTYIQAYSISALGGFPTGGATIGFMAKEQHLSAKEAKLLLAICHAPSPLFMIGFVGNELLQNPVIGWQMLFLFHSVNIIMLLFFIMTVKQQPPLKIQQTPTASAPFPLIESIKSSIPTVLLVGTTVIFFTTISFVIAHTLTRFAEHFPNILEVSLFSLLEMTSGLHMANQLFHNHHLFPLLLITILSFQGISIHLQVAVLAKDAAISLKPYAIVRAVQTVVIPLLYWLIFM